MIRIGLSRPDAAQRREAEAMIRFTRALGRAIERAER
jgi:hypothetical protein